MKTATSLTVIAVGAILAFAVTATPGFLNIQIVGWILMVTGAIGLTISRDNREWVRRRLIVRSSPELARAGRRVPRQRTAPGRRPARRRPPRQLVAAGAGQAAPAPLAADETASLAAEEPAPPNAPTEEIEPVTIEEFME
jgi:hypothetical protein